MASRQQLKTAAQMLRIANKHKAPYKAKLALIEAGLVESNLTNLRHGDRDSQGVLQLRTGIHGTKNAQSVRRSTEMFLKNGFTGRGGAIKLSKGGGTAGQMAQTIQGSAFPERYDQRKREAEAIIRRLEGKGATRPRGSSNRSTRTTAGTPDRTETDTLTTVTPGVDNSAQRKAILLDYIRNRDKGASLLSTRASLKSAADIPEKRVSETTASIIPGRAATKNTTRTVRGKQKPAVRTKSKGFRAGNAWGGSQRLIRDAVRSIGSPGVSSAKRSSDPSGIGTASDHHVGAKAAYANDIPATGAQGAAIANKLKKYYGIKGNVIGTYARHPITASDGRKYTVQILWNVANHYDHVHVGMRRA